MRLSGQMRMKTRPTMVLLGDRSEDARVLGVAAVVAHHPVRVGWDAHGPEVDVVVVPVGRYGS